MKIVQNPHRGGPFLSPNAPAPSVETAALTALLSQCPANAATPLVSVDRLAPVSALWVKDERTRMKLGSFKALGAAYVIARHAAELSDTPDASTLSQRSYVSASAGNHGLSVAAGARLFGARAIVYIAQTVPDSFAARLQARGAEVVRQGADYAASMKAAQEAAQENSWTLLSDSSWDGYVDLPHLLMEGYLQMGVEMAAQCPEAPTHILLQAGVGGMAGAVAAFARKTWGDEPQIVVVEPSAAPALQASIAAGKPVFAGGPDSIMGRLDCKEPSLIGLNGLARDADIFATLGDDQVAKQLPRLEQAGLATTPSGGAGIAVLLIPEAREALEIGPEARVLCILSEQAE